MSSDVLGGTKKLNDGNEIPMIGLGISRIVGQESVDTSVSAALEAGYRLFDTAELYANEAELGAALETHMTRLGIKRPEVFITTKVQTKDGDAANWAERSVMESLDKLRIEYIDLVLVHFPRDRYTGDDDAFEVNKQGRKDVWQKLEELKERGLIKSIGVSNYEVYHLVELLEYAKHIPTVNQFEFHPYFTRQTLVHYCEQNGIFVQVRSVSLFYRLGQEARGIERTMLGVTRLTQVREGLRSSELRRRSKIRDAVAWAKSSKIRSRFKFFRILQAFSSLLWGNKEILNEPVVQQLSNKFGVTPQVSEMLSSA
ncbi:unnamed protein product [Heligmosomoides polygyrus]|uniref:Aldo_ket_red domain-containing protein n=1 Tax=Heligmosomoides polygyrus TaxID=6339 RepID=A0A183FDQ1_HELPZ|nr:unnamed protein product [Heligmosomoides polygyrus]